MDNKINEETILKVKELFKSKTPETEIRKYIRESLGLAKTRANEIYLELKAKIEEIEKTGLDFTNVNKIYNKETDSYIIKLKSMTKPLVVSAAKHKAICRSYSSMGENLTCHQICVKYSLTPQVFNEYRKIFNLVKDREPLTEEDIVTNSIDDNVQSLLEDRRYKIYQQYEHESWKEIQSKAKKWDDFQNFTLDTVSRAIEGWKPTALSTVKSPKIKDSAKYTFIVGANDWHIGEFYKKDTGFYGDDFNSNIAVSLIDSYSNKIEESILSRKYSFKECVCVVNGDILNSAWQGATVKGTPLHNDKINEEMFKVALDSTTRFIERLALVFPKVSVTIVQGNHDGPLLSILGMAIQAYFRKVDSVNILVSQKWAEVIRVDNVGILITHGGAAFVKSQLPQSTLRLKSYLQDMWACHAESLIGCKSRIVISGHFHRFWQQDMGHFDFYCFGGLPTGDSYADSLNLRSTPRQNALILDSERVLETLHYYP